MPSTYSAAPDCAGGCADCDGGGGGVGLTVSPRGCGCGCYDAAIDPSPWVGQSGAPQTLCGCTVTLKLSGVTVATCTASATYPCAPCKFTGLANGTYTVEVGHPKFTTATTSYNYTGGDKTYSPTLCQSTGHCLGCPEPLGDTLNLNIVKNLSSIANGGWVGWPSPPVGPIPTAGLSVTLTWRKWPWWSDYADICDGYPGPIPVTNPYKNVYAWYGEASISAPYADPEDVAVIKPCDGAGGGVCLHRDDCGHFTIHNVALTFYFMLERCGSGDLATGFRLRVFSPTGWSCATGEGCATIRGFFVTDSPTPRRYTWPCAGLTYCDVMLPGERTLGANNLACNPYALSFVDAGSTFGTVTIP